MADQLVKRTVLFDTYNWMTLDSLIPGRTQHNTARRGEVIDVTEAEAVRGERLGALGSEADLATTRAAGSPGSFPDEQLRGLKADELVGYLAQHPLEADRLEALENERPEGKRRKTVLDAIGATREALEMQRAQAELAGEPAAAGAPTIPG